MKEEQGRVGRRRERGEEEQRELVVGLIHFSTL
jgi:hypothetical protein